MNVMIVHVLQEFTVEPGECDAHTLQGHPLLVPIHEH